MDGSRERQWCADSRNVFHHFVLIQSIMVSGVSSRHLHGLEIADRSRNPGLSSSHVFLRRAAYVRLFHNTRIFSHKLESVAIRARNETFRIAAEANRPLPGRSDLRQGDVLGGGRYEVIDILGRGSNGVTYRCLNKNPDKENPAEEVAIKALSLKGLKDWKQLELFEREAQILNNLDHPGIPRYLEYFEEERDDDQSFYLVQELVKGITLADAIQSSWGCDEAIAFSIASQLLKTIQYLGGRRPAVTHRDIKPENIVLSPEFFNSTARERGRVFLVDFGGVQAAASAMGDRFGSTIVGTYGYMSPESFRGAAQPASDVYSVGATMLFLLTGRPPSAFPVDRMRIDFSSAELSSKMRRLLEGLLEPVAEDRLTASEALSVIEGSDIKERKAPSRRQVGGSVAFPSNPPRQKGGDPPVKVTSKPAGSKIKVKKTSGRLEIDIPPSGIGGVDPYTGVFAIAWNAFVAFWTVGALAGGGIFFALFSLPFWFAGATIAKQAIGRSLIRERLIITRSIWKLETKLALLNGSSKSADWDNGAAREKSGRSRDLVNANLQVTAYVNNVPQTQLVLKEGVTNNVFGEGLDPLEQQWLVSEINSFIKEIKGYLVESPDDDTALLNNAEEEEWNKKLENREMTFSEYIGAKADVLAEQAQARGAEAAAKARSDADKAVKGLTTSSTVDIDFDILE